MNKEIRYIFLLCLLPVLTLNHEVKAQENKVDPNGYNRFFYASGALSSEGNLKDGQPEGYWKNYYESGVLKSEGNRIGHALDSIWKFYSREGILLEEIAYSNGLKHGISNRYSNEGFLVSSVSYVDDKKHGKGFTYFSNGAVKTEVTYEHGAENGRAFEFNDKGELITITTYKNGIFIKQEQINRKNKEGQKVGTWKEFYDNGNLKSEGNYSNDRKDGYWKEFSESGDLVGASKYDKGAVINDAEELANLEMIEKFYPDSDGKIRFRGTMRDGKKHGTHIWYALSGEIDSAKVYKNDVLIGEGKLNRDGLRYGDWVEFYYPTGEIKAKGKYKGGYRHDEWVYFFRSGEREQVGKYGEEGLPEGKWLWYYEGGQIQREEHYRNGREHGWMKEYLEDGREVSSGEYVNGLEEGEWVMEMGDHLERGMYEAGMKQGQWVHYYLSNGNVRFEGTFFDELPHGKHTWYYDNGVKMLEGRYEMGIQEGEWRRYNKDGSIFVSIEYSSGIEVKVDGVKLKVK